MRRLILATILALGSIVPAYAEDDPLSSEGIWQGRMQCGHDEKVVSGYYLALLRTSPDAGYLFVTPPTWNLRGPMAMARVRITPGSPGFVSLDRWVVGRPFPALAFSYTVYYGQILGGHLHHAPPDCIDFAFELGQSSQEQEMRAMLARDPEHFESRWESELRRVNAHHDWSSLDVAAGLAAWQWHERHFPNAPQLR